MLQLVYISSLTPGTPLAEIASILRSSRRNNAADRITGLLLFDGRRFLQALEGEAEAVERAFLRIRADPRHRAIVKLSERTVDVREFGDWAMAGQDNLIGGQPATIDLVDRLVNAVPDANVRETFRGFARIVRAA